MASRSLVFAATTTTWQVVPDGRLPVGLTVMVFVPLPVTPKPPAKGVPAGHSRVKDAAVTVTGSSKVMRMSAVLRTAVAPLVGVVVVMVGGVSVVKLKT